MQGLRPRECRLRGVHVPPGPAAGAGGPLDHVPLGPSCKVGRGPAYGAVDLARPEARLRGGLVRCRSRQDQPQGRGVDRPGRLARLRLQEAQQPPAPEPGQRRFPPGDLPCAPCVTAARRPWRLSFGRLRGDPCSGWGARPGAAARCGRRRPSARRGLLGPPADAEGGAVLPESVQAGALRHSAGDPLAVALSGRGALRCCLGSDSALDAGPGGVPGGPLAIRAEHREARRQRLLGLLLAPGLHRLHVGAGRERHGAHVGADLQHRLGRRGAAEALQGQDCRPRRRPPFRRARAPGTQSAGAAGAVSPRLGQGRGRPSPLRQVRREERRGLLREFA
mmetsp:Transcript_79975/g.246663  ORF Transcript_79975/g.246663 Transcript_79975/m.246663 type:complete len:336 (+) Transcript_79975:1587-2594(+)